MDNFILNWTNKCRHDDSAVLSGVIHMATELKSKGYKLAEAKDMLLSNDMNINVVESALKTVYMKKVAKVVKDTARKLPTSYEDLKPFVSAFLHSSEPKDFVDALTSSKEGSAIIEAGSKSQSSLLRLAMAAKESKTYETALHNQLSLFLEEELFKAVEASETIKNTKTASGLKIDTQKLTCSCNKFMSRNYSKLGLVCEHIINKCK